MVERQEFSYPQFQEVDKPRHECGVYGVYDFSSDVSRLTFFGLYALQHRGQESVGIAVSDGVKFYEHRQMGLVSSLKEEDIAKLRGYVAIGHTRYSNTGGTTIANAQPVFASCELGKIAISENGNLVNAQERREDLLRIGLSPSTHQDGSRCSSDGELIAQTIAAAQGKNWVEKIQNASLDLKGAYSLTIIAGNTLFGVKDPLGFWPLCLGRINDQGYVLASESCALDTIGAKFIRELEHGEIIAINQKGIRSYYLPDRIEERAAACSFDPNYFLRPDSRHLGGERVYQIRLRLGRQLVIEQPVNADVVISVPDSGEFGAVGYSEQSGIPLACGFIKNKYIGRTFIMPDQRIRELGVRLKLNPLPEELRGKCVVLVDDSAVRGTNSRLITEFLLSDEIGATEVHWRFTFPQITDPCHFGIDTYSRKQLIGAGRTVEEIRQEIRATSVGFNSVEGFEKALGRSLAKFCQGCFTGKYPINVPVERDKLILER
ncbi:amidophosphoribosyltransferase [Candidatus Curtissbacteria bacterium RBG_16_39_7]|uniref:Amidophosphoribosyltransferase n=1 Tax=Candidatus Curtissbacteria bacterium RBG_16_39_7 TaxID=1797707 RepID=A0A1F5G2G4_9BACT|nr:MAG: amidophosphoribosyltransferase [Candidatus Curtissbacteria bacterium RBG_16_39_7]